MELYFPNTQVTMKDLNTQETLKFRFERWLSRGEEDRDTWREQPAQRPGKPQDQGRDGLLSDYMSISVYIQ